MQIGGQRKRVQRIYTNNYCNYPSQNINPAKPWQSGKTTKSRRSKVRRTKYRQSESKDERSIDRAKAKTDEVSTERKQRRTKYRQSESKDERSIDRAKAKTDEVATERSGDGQAKRNKNEN